MNDLAYSMSTLREFVGKELGVSAWTAVTQEMIDDFAAATRDRQWIHIDPARAQAGFALGEPLPPLRAVVDQWTRKHPDRSVAIVLDEIDTILRTERRA